MATNLTERFRSATRATPTNRCAVGVVSGSMEPKIAKELQGCLSDLSISGSAISLVLREEGHEVSAFSVRRHRRGECSCR